MIVVVGGYANHWSGKGEGMFWARIFGTVKATLWII